MSVILSLFNHKGGVSKTTTAFNLGWALADMGYKVLLVDADPQCNLTGMTLELSGRDDLQQFYLDNPQSNIYTALRPAFGGEPRPLQPAIPVSTRHSNLLLLAGHIEVATYEPELSMAHKILGAMPILANLPGAIGFLIRETASSVQADITIVDMSPSVGALNQNIWMQSDFFIVPTSPDYFCLMAIDSLATVLPNWHATAEAIRSQQSGISYKLPDSSPVFIGMISQRYRPRSGQPVAAFQSWIDSISERVRDNLVPALAATNAAISEVEFRASSASHEPYELARIADFNSLIAQSQDHATPVFALTDNQLNREGIVLERMREASNNFRETFESLATSVASLCHLREIE
jgi:chromosome partitioning protein